MNLLSRLFGSQIKSFDLEVKFHKEANFFGEHGTIVVSHVKQGLNEVPVRFVFVGITTPPKLTLSLMAYIWEQAKYQGYIPHDLQTYGKDNEVCRLGNAADSIDVSTVAASMAAHLGGRADTRTAISQ